MPFFFGQTYPVLKRIESKGLELTGLSQVLLVFPSLEGGVVEAVEHRVCLDWDFLFDGRSVPANKNLNVPVNNPVVDGSLTLHLRFDIFLLFTRVDFYNVFFNILHPLHSSLVKNRQRPQRSRCHFLRFYKLQQVKILLQFVDGLSVEALIGADFPNINATTAYAFHHAPAALALETTEDIRAK